MYQFDMQRTGRQSKLISKDHTYTIDWSSTISSIAKTGSETTPLLWDDLIIIGAHSGELVAINKNGGSVAWRFLTELKLYSTPLIYNSKLYIISGAGDLHILNKEGVELFKKRLSDIRLKERHIPLILMNVLRKRLNMSTKKFSIGTIRNWASLNFSKDQYYAVIAGEGLIAFDQGGMVMWRHCLGNKNSWHLTGVAITEDGKIIAPSMRKYVFCLDQMGHVLWKTKTSSNVIHWSNPAVDERLKQIYLGTESTNEGGGAIALDFNGAVVWRTDLGQAVRGSTLIGDGYNLFVPGLGGMLFRIDARNGKVINEYKLSGDSRGIWSSPTMDAAGTVLISVKIDRYNGGIYKIDSQGVGSWLFKGPKVLATPLIMDDGAILFGAWDNTVKCLK